MYHKINGSAINGESNGLEILLDAEQFNYAYYKANGAGFEISLHDHRSKPMMQYSSEKIQVGSSVQINLKPYIQYTSEHAMSKFKPEERNCYKCNCPATYEKKLFHLKYEFGYKYDMNNCLVDRCITDIILNCQCLPQLLSSHDLMSHMKTDSICSGQKLYCAQKIEETLGLQHSDVCLI